MAVELLLLLVCVTTFEATEVTASVVFTVVAVFGE